LHLSIAGKPEIEMSFTYIVLWSLTVWGSAHINPEIVQTYSAQAACEHDRSIGIEAESLHLPGAEQLTYRCVPRVVRVN
jgi:hypothetical protein